jgi:(p)ppGpp synthase/HD superfamily hydrolase
MNATRQLAEAISLAANLHAWQEDKAGKPYILHPLRVMQRLRTDDLELMAIAVFHDVVEDCGISYSELLEKGFSIRVVEGIMCLTKRDETYEDFILRCKANPDARRVKIEDLRDNSDITRLKGVTAKDLERLEKYNRAYKVLTE